MTHSAKKITEDHANGRILATGTTLAVVMITITPLCGYLFECGCTWPGLGLDSACNIHDKLALHQCPWCASAPAGWLSVGLAALAGGMASVYPIYRFLPIKSLPLLNRILSGVSAYLIAAIISGVISAYLQGYPLS